MELTLKRYEKDPYPGCGFFVEGEDPTRWIAAVDRLGLDPAHIRVYGLPSRRANVPWGYLVITTGELPADKLDPFASAHLAASQLIVPAKSRVLPELTDHDLKQLFREDTYVLHPDFGLFKLMSPLLMSDCLVVEEVPVLASLRPADYVVSSGEVVAFSVAATPREDIESALDAGVAREKLADAPLSLAEKLRLKLYESVMTGDGDKATLNPRADKLQRLAVMLGLSGANAHDHLLEDFRDLQNRNKREVDKLLDLMQKDPEAALRYAIPLDEHGSSRGGPKGTFKMRDRGSGFSLFGGRAGGAGGSVDIGDELHRLRQQYVATARALENSGKHEKAAYVYLKLLKNHTAAAETLKKGKFYEKAAVVCLRYLKNERAAAECYEAGKIYAEAITLYEKLEDWEKAGDLNVLRGDDESAQTAYERQLEKELLHNALIRAAKLSKEKLRNLPRAQEILLRGWEENVNAYNCLQYYLANITDGEAAWREIKRISEHQLNTQNDRVFLKVLSGEYAKKDEHREDVKDMAYGLLSKLLSDGRISAHELLAFNDKNSRLRADTLRYELSKHKVRTRPPA
ncbi:soluble NSF attachment family protein [Neolewinella antarctica]|uniref:MoxR-vWA-beta-propeller ternary system domain-containing protein n=1 Tax=Neolewinella antarctica TaxID=442734 RepID=A0ABX0XCW1_9BACT|nr:hypothetical protein [Neolewinella antarctica]NJC27105.1 hypothetical protein [Neolewinella antarctica]